MTGPYDDIIHLPHHVSDKHPRMPVADRAAQFQPFRALSGYEDAVTETARLTEDWIDQDEGVKGTLNRKLRIVAEHLADQPEITVTCFQPDKRKAGGSYVTITGYVKKLDSFERVMIMRDGERIPIDSIYEIQSAIFPAFP